MGFLSRISMESTIRFFKLHPIEITLIFLATLITIISFVLQTQSNTHSAEVLSAQTIVNDHQKQSDDTTMQPQRETIFVDVSGAVLEPDVYEVSVGARLKDAVEAAGGLSSTADDLYVARNYNLAKRVADQEKIYIPYTWDISNGTFVEQTRILEYLQPGNQTAKYVSDGTGQAIENQSQSLQISINTSSKEELEMLSGVGPVTAQKIIESRPYSMIEELVSRKVMNQSTLEKIKNNIDL